MNPGWSLLVGVLLLLGNAFFVGAEFALVSARRTQIEPKARAGSAMARTTLHAMENVSQMMAGAQLGITVCSLGLGAVAEPALAHLFEPMAEAIGLPQAAVHPAAFVVALALVVYLHVVLGEMVPKNLALAGPERAALLFGPPMAAIVTVLRPAVVLLNMIANGVVRLLRMEPRDEVASSFTREQVEAMVDESRDVGLLEEGEYERLSGALGLTVRTVREVLVPMDDLDTVPHGARATDVEELCAQTGFSRFPVTGDDGRLVGYLHVKDVLQPDPHGRARPVEDRWVRPFASVPVDISLVQALTTMQAKGAHMALVRDAEGTPVGVATLEDVLEELVGEIQDASHSDVALPGAGAAPA